MSQPRGAPLPPPPGQAMVMVPFPPCGCGWVGEWATFDFCSNSVWTRGYTMLKKISLDTHHGRGIIAPPPPLWDGVGWCVAEIGLLDK
jgi:hypothetical protein